MNFHQTLDFITHTKVADRNNNNCIEKHGGNSGGNSSIPVDSFSLNYTKIKYEYMPQKADGSLEGAIMAMYDRALNKVT